MYLCLQMHLEVYIPNVIRTYLRQVDLLETDFLSVAYTSRFYSIGQEYIVLL